LWFLLSALGRLTGGDAPSGGSSGAEAAAARIAELLARGDLEAARRLLDGQEGLEAHVLRAGLKAVPEGPETVEQVMLSALAAERPRYERFLSLLGTLGNNAPFIGLFGTVLGIIKAFNDLGAVSLKGSAIQQTVMTGISEALVATAVGLAVAIPAVGSTSSPGR
jgi:biopolymer transport protein ExbB